MTFPGDPEDEHAGDIAVCPAVAADASRDSGLPFNKELSLYLIHAWLHLAGLKDDTPGNTAEMREGETLLMRHLEQSDSFLNCEWRVE
jgi:probable rRNA maturation factor